MSEPRVPAAAALHGRRAARPAARRGSGRRRDRATLLAGLDDATLLAAHPQPRRPRPRGARRGLRRDRRHPPDGHLRLHGEGPRPAHRGPPAEPFLAADRGAAGRARRRGSARDPADPWQRFAAGSAPGGAVRRRRRPAAARPRVPLADRPTVPADLGRTPTGTATTQAALGRALLDLTRRGAGGGAASSRSARTSARAPTSAGWVNKVGVWSPTSARLVRRRRRDDPALAGATRPASTSSSASPRSTWSALIGELGATWSRWGEPLLPDRHALRPVRRARAGAVVVRHLRRRPVDPGRHAVRRDPRAEGGAHQSIKTPSIGLEQPGCVSYEPAFAMDVEWCCSPRSASWAGPAGSRPTCGCRRGRSTRRWRRCPPIRPPASGAVARWSPAGTCCARPRSPAVTIAAMGALVPEALAAADRLAAIGRRRRRRLRHQPRPAVRRALQARPGPCRGARWILDAASSRRARRADGDRARRPPAHPGVPRRASTGCRRATSASPSSASPATWTASTAITASTPAR